MGIIVSLSSKKIVDFFKNELNTMIVSIAFFLFILIFLVTEDIVYLFVLLFLFCIGMFTVHTVSTGLANSMKSSQKSLTSGMYLTFYYIGGASGSFFPSIILGIFDKRMNKQGAIAGIFTGFTFTLGYIVYFAFINRIQYPLFVFG